jgi:hypothetical protein
MHSVCMLKVTERIFYRYQEENLHLAAIYRKIRKKCGRAKILASVIEVFFKMAKSFLNLARECQGRSYDALVAHATTVYCRYIMLALAKRTNQDTRTLGTLFYACCEELQQASFAEALMLLLSLLEEVLSNVAGISKELICSLVERFLSELQPFLKNRLLLSGHLQPVSY